MDLVTAHIARLEQDGRSQQTLHAYRYDAKKLAKLAGGVRGVRARCPPTSYARAWRR
jgi:hypothetical protein